MVYKEYIDFDNIKDVKCVHANGKLESIQSVYNRTHADIVINTCIFEFDTGEIKSRIVCDGAVYGTKQSDVFGFSFTPTPVWNWNNVVHAANYLAPYAYAVINKEARDGLKDKSRRGRTAIGITSDKRMLIYVVTDNDSQKCSTTTLCQRLIDFGCVHAINLDGGGSSQVYSHNAKYSSGRPCAGFLCIWLKSADKPSTMYRVQPSSLNVRSGAGVLYRVVGSYRAGDIVPITTIKNGWGETPSGWVNMSYLSMYGDVQGIAYKVTASKLNVRSGPSPTAKVIGVVKRNDLVYVVDASDEWSDIGSGHWVSSLYLKRV